MRVVGGKTGADGRLFAYIVWTVPGGPAEKAGLQQGDKVRRIHLFTEIQRIRNCHQKYIQVLEWDGTSLIDRSFEEVCSIMDRTGDVAELLVEHSTDLRMCDLLEEGITPGGGGPPGAGGPRKSGDGAVGLGLIAGKFRFYSRFVRVYRNMTGSAAPQQRSLSLGNAQYLPAETLEKFK